MKYNFQFNLKIIHWISINKQRLRAQYVRIDVKIQGKYILRRDCYEKASKYVWNKSILILSPEPR